MIRQQLCAFIKLSFLDLYRRKDLFVLLVLSCVLLTPLALLRPFGQMGGNRYMNEIAMLMIWVFSFIIALGASSRLFPPEFESRTIYPLLSKPVSRGVVLLGKYLGALSTSISALAIFYFLYAMLNGFRGGEWFSPLLLQAFVLHCGFTAIVVALGLLGSLLVTTSANITLTSTIVVVMFLFGRRLPHYIAADETPVRWTIAAAHAIGPHVEFFDLRQRLVHSWEMISWPVCALALIYAASYSVTCLWLAWLALRRTQL